MRLSAYYYSFESTGNDAVDRILESVAIAGKMYHNTECWNDTPGWSEDEPSPVERIQNAANDAAKALTYKEEDGQ